MRTALLFIAGLALAACATSQPAGQGLSGAQANEFDLSAASGDSLTAVCTEGGCSGPTVQLNRSREGFSGMLGNRPIELSVGQTQVTGAVDGQPVQLQVSDQPGQLGVSGTFAGQLGNFTLTPDALEGRVGHCSYDLRAVGPGSYSGQRACAGGPVQTRVRIPASLTSRPASERAALLATLLAH